MLASSSSRCCSSFQRSCAGPLSFAHLLSWVLCLCHITFYSLSVLDQERKNLRQSNRKNHNTSLSLFVWVVVNLVSMTHCLLQDAVLENKIKEYALVFYVISTMMCSRFLVTPILHTKPWILILSLCVFFCIHVYECTVHICIFGQPEGILEAAVSWLALLV